MPIPQLPPELIEGILQTLWHDVLTAWQRIHFMKSCPLVNREWRALYDMIASRDVYIPSMQYLHYLLRIITRTIHHHRAKVDLGDSNWASFRTDVRPTRADGTYKRLLSELQYSSFSGVHLCFPAATHIIFEAITTRRTVDLKYTQLRVRLDGHTTVNALWREEHWTSWSRDQLACSVINALDGHMDFDLAGFPPDADDVCDELTLERDNILALPVSWEPEPFPRAAVGYYSFYILLDYLRHWWDDVQHRPLSPLYNSPKCFHIKQDVQPFYGQRILDVLLAVPVNMYHSFLACVSILTLFTSFVITSFQFLIGLVFSIIIFLVRLLTICISFLLRLAFWVFKIFIRRLVDYVQEVIKMYY
ncbi:hypothetical protein CPB85DRAFT_1333169 [Mucidula mucida]|nr:hypothetical protein CPB85DRAFT_1333169 [Mucidula mucida]